MEETRDSVLMEENGMEIDLKGVKKHFSKIGWMFVLGTIAIYAAQLIPLTIVQFLRPEWIADANMSILVSMLPMYLIGMPILILLVKGIPSEKPENHPIKAGQFIIAAIMCFALVYLSNIVGTITTTIIGALKGGEVQNQILNATVGMDLWMIFIFMVICAPIMEELIFRRLIVDRTMRYGQGVAVLVSGLMFGLFHGNLNQFVYAFVLGVFLAYLYAKTGNLKITIGLHMLINFFGGVVSTWLIRLIDLDEYYSLAMDADTDALMNFLGENLVGCVAYMVYFLFIISVMIVGAVLIIVSLAKKKFVLNRGSFVIPKGKKFSTVILNGGMIVYSAIWIITIVLQLFM